MKAKLIVEGKEFDIEINDPELQKLVAPPKKTGYERSINKGQIYIVDRDNDIGIIYDSDDTDDRALYENANYYTDVKLAKNNARADKLMRQLRRFAVEYRTKNIDWNSDEYKYTIRCGYLTDVSLNVDTEVRGRDFGVIYFDSKETAQVAIDTFYDELIWYFTEYKDSL